MSETEERFCLAPSSCHCCRAYPLKHPGPDERFAESLINCVAGVLVAYGYPRFENVNDWAALEEALAGFLYRPYKKDSTP